MKKIILIEGMSCEHCANAVKNALEEITDVKSAKVELKKKRAIVKLNSNVENNALTDAVDKAGFKATSIEEK